VVVGGNLALAGMIFPDQAHHVFISIWKSLKDPRVLLVMPMVGAVLSRRGLFDFLDPNKGHGVSNSVLPRAPEPSPSVVSVPLWLEPLICDFLHITPALLGQTLATENKARDQALSQRIGSYLRNHPSAMQDALLFVAPSVSLVNAQSADIRTYAADFLRRLVQQALAQVARSPIAELGRFDRREFLAITAHVLGHDVRFPMSPSSIRRHV